METQTNKYMHYFKCVDCLTPVSLYLDTQYRKNPEITCDCGGTTFEWMGRVEGDKSVKEEERCKCNSLCTFAAGPNCDCSCLGKNHGIGMLAFETVDVVTGKVRFTAKVKDKNKDHAIWFRSKIAAKADLSLYGKLAAVKKANQEGQRIEWDTYRMVARVESLFREFQKARTVKKRNKIITQIEAITA
jgi:hypothetical protein